MARQTTVLVGALVAIAVVATLSIQLYRSDQADLIARQALCESLKPEFAGSVALAHIRLLQTNGPSKASVYVEDAKDPARFDGNPNAATLARVNSAMVQEWEAFPRDPEQLKAHASVRGFMLCVKG